MACSGVCKFLFNRTAELFVIILFIVILPGIPPNAKYTPFTVTPSLPFESTLKLNNKLDDVELWHKGAFYGPESFADYNGELYTTLHGGDVVKLSVGSGGGQGHITPVTKFGKPCKGFHEEAICGRPLGLSFDTHGNLFVVDAYYGIFKVNVKTGKSVQIVSPDEVIDGKASKTPNSVAVAKNGDLYWTDSSTEFTLQDGIFVGLADATGRLIHYDATTRKNNVLIRDLHYANGVILSDNEEFVLVVETLRNRIHRYYLTGAKSGKHDIFIDGLPGLPDNIQSDRKSGFLVALVSAVDSDHPGPFQMIGQFPLIRKFVSRVLGITQFAFKIVNDIYPNEFAQKAVHYVGHFGMTRGLVPDRVTILHLSKTGEILDSVHTFNRRIGGISEAYIFKDTLYLGSPFSDQIGRIKLDKIGWGHLKQIEVQPTTQKPTTTTPKPTTTTPKPTTTTPKPTTTTPKPTTTTPKPTTTTPKPTTTVKPKVTSTTTTSKPSTTVKPKTAAPTTPKVAATTPSPAKSVKEQSKSVPLNNGNK